jgi:hypothetical protein
VPLGRNRARPSCKAGARTTATRAHGPWPHGARPSCAAHGLDRCSVCGPARRRRCSVSQRWHGDGVRETTEERAAHWRGDGGAARCRWASGGGSGDAASVGTAVRSARRSGRRREGRGGGGAHEGRLSGVAARCPDSVLKERASGAAHGSHAATARFRVGPARRAGSNRWGPLISDFRIKNHPV